MIRIGTLFSGGLAAQDFAHADRGYRRDDRRAALLCQSCHKFADQPNYTKIELSKEINRKLKLIAEENFYDFFM